MDDTGSRQLTITVEADEARRFRILAEAECRSLSSLGRLAILEHLRRRGTEIERVVEPQDKPR